MSRARREWLFASVIAAACFVLFFVDLAPTSEINQGRHARALVTAVDNSSVRTNLIVRTETQILSIRLLSGPHRGQQMTVANNLTGKLEFDEFYTPGSVILVEYDVVDGELKRGLARGHYRLGWQLFLVGIFATLLVLIAGVTGLKAALSFIFAAMVLWKVFFPLLLLGYPPIPTGLAVVALLTGVVTFSVGGLSRRGLATFSGSMLGVLLTCGLASWLSGAFSLHGAVRPFAENLLYSGYYELRLTEIFIASVFIACSGAVMDLAMDIAASMEEIAQSRPDVGLVEHVFSGLRVGRAVVGTMTTTLLLAYSSSHISMFLLFLAKGLPLPNLLNAPFVSAEILNILVGSFGLVTVAPFTAVVAGLLYHFSRHTKSGPYSAENASASTVVPTRRHLRNSERPAAP